MPVTMTGNRIVLQEPAMLLNVLSAEVRALLMLMVMARGLTRLRSEYNQGD